MFNFDKIRALRSFLIIQAAEANLPVFFFRGHKSGARAMDGGGSRLTRSDSPLLKSQCSLGNWHGALLISPSELTLLYGSKQAGDHSAGATRWPSGNVDA